MSTTAELLKLLDARAEAWSDFVSVTGFRNRVLDSGTPTMADLNAAEQDLSIARKAWDEASKATSSWLTDEDNLDVLRSALLRRGAGL